MKKIKLITREEAWKRAEKIKKEYEDIYGIEFRLENKFIPLDSLVPTQRTLSEVKLLIVLQEIKHGYDAPVIVIPYRDRYYLLDGHHRALALIKLGFKSAEAIIIRPKGKFVPGVVKTAEKSGLRRLEDMKIVRD